MWVKNSSKWCLRWLTKILRSFCCYSVITFCYKNVSSFCVHFTVSGTWVSTVGVTVSSNPRLSNTEAIAKRNTLFSNEKSRQASLVTRVTKIKVKYEGTPKPCTMIMNKDMSTPYDCAKRRLLKRNGFTDSPIIKPLDIFTVLCLY